MAKPTPLNYGGYTKPPRTSSAAIAACIVGLCSGPAAAIIGVWLVFALGSFVPLVLTLLACHGVALAFSIRVYLRLRSTYAPPGRGLAPVGIIATAIWAIATPVGLFELIKAMAAAGGPS